MAASSKCIELTPWLLAFGNSYMCPKGPISMLNLVSSRPFASVQESYSSYIETMKEETAAKHGLVVKLWEESGTGMEEEKGVSGGGWDEVALVGYSSFQHFANMLDDGEY
jgi:hypothetical protein